MGTSNAHLTKLETGMDSSVRRTVVVGLFCHHLQKGTERKENSGYAMKYITITYFYSKTLYMEYSDMRVRENRKPSKSRWDLAAKPPMGKNNLGKEA